MDASYNATVPPQERHFDFTVDRRMVAPDGIERLMYTINGEFPGPLIEVTEGDTLVVKVRNHIYDNYTVPPAPMSSFRDDVFVPGSDKKFTLHWHGMSMRGTQTMDGTSAITNCAILPGEEFEYRFVVHPEDVGTHWYHSHVGTSRADGLWGMLIVHARQDERALFQERAPEAETHWDEEVAVAMGDHFHQMSPISLGMYVSRWLQKAEPVPENALINGKSTFDCEHSRLSGVSCPAGDRKEVGAHSVFQLDEDKTYRLRLVNVGSLADMIFSVDEHTMTVIEADGTLVEPKRVHRLPISPGQRYSVVLHREPRSRAKRVWMRAEMEPSCFQYTNPVMQMDSKAIVSYTSTKWEGAGGLWAPLRVRSYRRALSEAVYGRSVQRVQRPMSHAWGANVTDVGIPEEPCHDLEPDALAPLIPDPAPELRLDRGDRRETVYVTVPILERYGIVPMGFMNSSTFRPYGQRGASRQPLLSRIARANSTNLQDWADQDVYDPEYELVAMTHPSEPIVYELVINNQDDSPHPFHLHGHKFWVMQTGEMDPRFGGYDSYEDVGQVYQRDRHMKRDTVLVPTMGHAVIRWRADNPGVWAFHCHMLVHQATGMVMMIAEQPSLLQGDARLTATCGKP